VSQPDTAFLIGNGPSRRCIDLNELRGKGTIFGCNALYRDFAPDYAVTYGTEMNEELIFSGFPIHRTLVCPFYEMIERPDGQFINNCMSAAMLHAGIRGFKKAYVLGADSLTNSTANIYHGKPGYTGKPKLDTNGIKLRMKSFAYVAKRFKGTTFIFLVPEKEKSVYTIDASNAKGSFYSTFATTFNLTLGG
jgi:hypothetical protein